MSLRGAYRRVVGFIDEGLFEIPSKSGVWNPLLDDYMNMRMLPSHWDPPKAKA